MPPTGKSTIRLLRFKLLRRKQKKTSSLRPLFPPSKENLGVGVGGRRSEGVERHNLLTWLINQATTKQLSPFITRTPDSLASWMACWSAKKDPPTSRSRTLVSISLFYKDPDRTTPHYHEVSGKPRFVPSLWWRVAVTRSSNKPILLLTTEEETANSTA